MYGYEIMKIIKEAFLEVHEATIYTILRRLNSDGYTETYFGNISNGPQRKYYKITNLGAEYLNINISNFEGILHSVRNLGIVIK